MTFVTWRGRRCFPVGRWFRSLWCIAAHPHMSLVVIIRQWQSVLWWFWSFSHLPPSWPGTWCPRVSPDQRFSGSCSLFTVQCVHLQPRRARAVPVLVLVAHHVAVREVRRLEWLLSTSRSLPLCTTTIGPLNQWKEHYKPSELRTKLLLLLLVLISTIFTVTVTVNLHDLSMVDISTFEL